MKTSRRTRPAAGSATHRARTAAMAGAFLFALSGCGGTQPTPIVVNQGGSPGASASTGPSTSASVPTPAAVDATVNFDKPTENSQVNPGDDVVLSGTVTGLNGREFWIVSRATFEDQLYTTSSFRHPLPRGMAIGGQLQTQVQRPKMIVGTTYCS